MTTDAPRYRLATDAALHKGAEVTLADNAAHYLTGVLRLKEGDGIALFSRADGEWRARIDAVRKKQVVLVVEAQRRAAEQGVGLTVCFAPIKGGRMETIIEKATELGASVLQPVITARTIVDKVNLPRAESIAREAAEQCERVDWPEIREPVKLAKLLGEWPADVPLIYGDESGASGSINTLYSSSPLAGEVRWGGVEAVSATSQPPHPTLPPQGGKEHNAQRPRQWAILAGPEGGFTPEEFALLTHVKAAVGVGLGPRILRADTAVITLCVSTLQQWGDWDQRPRFTKGD